LSYSPRITNRGCENATFFFPTREGRFGESNRLAARAHSRRQALFRLPKKEYRTGNRALDGFLTEGYPEGHSGAAPIFGRSSRLQRQGCRRIRPKIELPS